MRPVKTTMRKQSGIALITTLLLLMLMSAMVVGFILLVTEGQRLSGMNNDQSKAFYGAESGMEKLTADLGSLFSQTYAPTGPQVDALMLNPPLLSTVNGVNYVDAQGINSYKITYPKDNKGNPQAQFAQITSGSSPYQGMTALETSYTLTVGARTSNGGEVKLQRTTQTVGIPLFQFGIYCDGDCGFFPGPNFNFGGRIHSNGNLFLNSGGPAGAAPNQPIAGPPNQLWLANPVTVVKDVFRDCLSNNHPENAAAQHPGSVEITKGAGSFQALGFGQGSQISCRGSGKNPNWPTISASFNGNLRTGVKPMNLTITLAGSSHPVDMIRRPVQGEDASNPGVLGERYFAQASLRVLLSDDPNDITKLPCVSGGAPFNLADIALAPAAWVTANAVALKTAMTTAGTIPLPLATSGAQGGANYSPGTAGGGPGGTSGGDGYWGSVNNPVITGYIKIDAQTTYGAPCGAAVDVTKEILSLGYVGKNINPVPQSFDGNNLSPNWTGVAVKMEGGAAPALPSLPIIDPNTGGAVQMGSQNGAALAAGTFTAAQFNNGTCLDPHPNAVIRLERIRDNPSSVNVQPGVLKTIAPKNLPVQSTVAEVCGVDPATGKLATLRTSPAAAPATGVTWVPQASDFWPNVLFDAREGYNREPQPALNTLVTLGGVMNYIELDVKNLAKWFNGTLPAAGSTGPSTRDPNIAPNNFVVYVSDRRGNYAPTGAIAGTWPPLSPSGHETGEYGYGDFVNPADPSGCPNGVLDAGEDLDNTGVLFTYGEVTFASPTSGAYLFTNGTSNAAVVPDPLCPTGTGGIFPWPRAFLKYPNEGRENPPSLFRRALKLVNGNVITLPLCPGGVTCGLTVATENPVYIQGDYNANSAGGGFADPTVASAVIADAYTFLSNQWSDVNSFTSPFNAGGRSATTGWYRLGVAAGKGISFPIPGWDTTGLDGSQDFGTDGGVHNFMRYLERWGGTLNYTGSIISMYNNHQGVGLYNSGGNNYSPPNRAYQFDANFSNPALLPPRTPMFRDINTTGFTQLLLPNQ
jgi:hypothetical protein